MDSRVINEYFSKNGILKKSLPYFEYREEQLVMAEHVYGTFTNTGILIAEAQTGTGKTLAYLIPAVLSGKKTVISTGTKNLQEQIFKKDIPFLKDKLGLGFNASCMKGRANYICLKKYKHFNKQGTFEFKSDIKNFEEVAKWLLSTDTGDIEELTSIPDNAPFFKHITSSSEQCTGQKCPNVRECFITRMKERSLRADIIIINHHLFFADLSVKESSDQFVVVPHYHALIFDEAHQLEDTASSYFGTMVSNYKLEELIRDINFAVSAEKRVDEKLVGICDKFLRYSNIFFKIFRDFANKEESFKLSTLLRYKEKELIEALHSLYEAFDQLIAHLELMKDKSDELLNMIRRAKDIKCELIFIIGMDDHNYVYWCETRGKGAFLKANPIDVSAELREALFKKQDTIILTSATLAADKGFTYIKARLGIAPPEDSDEEDVRIIPDELILPSPFDFKSRVLHYLPVIKHEPSESGFIEESARHILEIITACGGRTFVLFTSNRNMRAVYDLISDKIPFKVLMQGDMPKSAVLKEFKEDTTSVLFATMSFWGGVDVQGESLLCVIIDKLPFASPKEPLVEAKINLIKEKNGNPFFDFQVPQAVITLKQGLGRLIRKKDDYGVLTILDKRLRTKGYGRKFISSLPKAKITSKINEVSDFLRKFS